MLFLINVVIAVATLWNAVEDHDEALSGFRSAAEGKRAKMWRKLFLLWFLPVLSIVALPFTWREETDVERKIADANARTSSNELAVARANERAEVAGQKAGEAQERAARLEKEAEQIRNENLKLAKVMAWRSFLNQDRAITNLAKFKGTKVRLSFERNDPESEDTSRKIEWALIEAGWTVDKFPHPLPGFSPITEHVRVLPWSFPRKVDMVQAIAIRSGVIVEWATPMHPNDEREKAQYTPARDAGLALINELNASNIEARTYVSHMRNEYFIPGIVWVHVGRRPGVGGGEGAPFYYLGR